MMSEVAAGLTSLKAALDLARGLNAANNQTKINEVKLALQDRIQEAQDALSAAREADFKSAEKIRGLEQEIAAHNDWEREKQRYVLSAVDRGAFAYTLRPGMEDGEPPHWCCPTCFQRRQKSFLQSHGNEDPRTGKRMDKARWACDTCKGNVMTYYGRNPATPWPGPNETA